MSNLETNVRPIMLPLLRGHLHIVDRARQLTVARWAVKTAMALEATSPSFFWFYRQAERRHVADQAAFPPTTMVWLSAYQGQHHAYAYATKLSGRAENGSKTHSYVTTMSFARLVIQVATTRTKGIPAGTVITADVRPGVWNHGALINVWPNPAVTAGWPPPRILTDENSGALEAFSDRFGV